jgi:hypothetical protein
MVDDRGDQLAGKLGGLEVALGLGQMSLQDRRRGALPEVGFERRRQRQPASGPQ